MKRIGTFLLCAGLLLCALSACGNGMDGTYYSADGDLYLKLSGGFWYLGEAGMESEDEATLSGPYVIEQGVISFRSVVLDGEDIEIFTGEADGNRLIVSFQGEAGTTVFYRNGEQGFLPEG